MTSYAYLRTYGDVDEFCEDARGWSLDFVPTRRGSFRSSVMQVGSGPVQVGRGRFRGSLIQRGAPPAGHWTFVVPTGPAVTFRWRGHAVRGDSMLVFPLNGELHSASGPDFDVYTIAVSAPHLEAVADAQRLPAPSRLIGSAEVFRDLSASLADLRQTVATVSRAVALGLPPDGPELTRLLHVELPTLLLQGTASASGRSNAIASSRRTLVDGIGAHLDGALGRTVPTVRELTGIAGTSTRTLRRAFQEFYGCGPKEFLLAHRYNAARRLLRDADPADRGVSALTGRLGFWHAGSFAAEYRRRFGELPHETLSRRPREGGRRVSP